ncbi:putative lea domain-containing protein [Golovinomyces cichoracearum]|uniref:Putative lea domain-containing protein n=1 Tax=Golovinomyces cichoracearum TaxID=62708 RepID=A0A420IFE2_9PEZI|nr:putative lea domain-containing protein [Golovinomyces cichoracearum]
MTSLARVAAGYVFSCTKFAPRTTASFSTSFLQKNKAADAFREKAKDVDQAVSNKIVDGISMGQSITEKAKELSGVFDGDLKEKTKEFSGVSEKDVKGKTKELRDQAKEKKEDLKKKI